MMPPAKETRPIGAFDLNRPAKSTIRLLVRVGAVPPPRPGRTIPTRDLSEALDRVVDGQTWIKERRRAAGLPGGNPSFEEGWREWLRQHPASAAARGASAARLASRAFRRAQGDFFADMAGRA